MESVANCTIATSDAPATAGDSDCCSASKKTDYHGLQWALDELDRIAPGVPLLALGQTIFWDEPMKAGLAKFALERGRRFVAGIHDTDYFAKIPSGEHRKGLFTALPHNDGSTRGLWSAAGEFSALFGSETVVTREILKQAGLKIDRLEQADPNFLDEATEAWGWRGIVSLDERPPVTAEIPAQALAKELCKTLNWALDSSIELTTGHSREAAKKVADEIHTKLCDLLDLPGKTVACVYRAMLPAMYSLVAGQQLDIETTQTTELLRFNRSTASLPRFQLLRFFVNQSTRAEAKVAYDRAIESASGIYELDKFGTGAIPFDLVVPGKGRGTIRLGKRGVVINTPKPIFFHLSKPLETVEELAALIEDRLGDKCVLVGKAVTLIGMLSREFAFVFHEGASSYVTASARLHEELSGLNGGCFHTHPIVRIQYSTWDSLAQVKAWLKLPPELKRPFGTDDLCAPSFAARWKTVAEEQQVLLTKLGSLRRPIDLIRFLDEQVGGAWREVANEYLSIHSRLERVRDDVDSARSDRKALYAQLDDLKASHQMVQKQMGEHFRAEIFEIQATPSALARREAFKTRLGEIEAEMRSVKTQLHRALHTQAAAAQTGEAVDAHDRRRQLELEAEMKRLRMIREAVQSTKGLQNANRRPGAWWIPMVSPDGTWFHEINRTATCRLEHLC